MDRVPNISPITLLVEWNDRDRVFAKGGPPRRLFLLSPPPSRPSSCTLGGAKGRNGEGNPSQPCCIFIQPRRKRGEEGEEVSPACAHITNNTAVMTEAA